METALVVNDIFKTGQGILHAGVNGVRQYYDNYYDQRHIRFNFTYRLGNLKINARQRSEGNEQEKNRAY